MTQTGSPAPRNDRICITSSCPRQLVVPTCRFLRGQQQRRLPVSLTTNHDGPGNPGYLVGQGDGGPLGRPRCHQPSQPGMLLRAVLLRIADDGHGTIDEQPPQVSIALLRNAAELVLAAARVLLRHQPDPGGQTSS